VKKGLLLDALLVTAILVSVVYIGSRYFQQNENESPSESVSQETGAAVTQATRLQDLHAEYSKRKGMWILEDMRPASESEFVAAFEKAGLSGRLVEKTPGCAADSIASEPTVRMSGSKILDLVEQSKFNVMLGFFSPRQPCYRVNNTIHMVSYDRGPEANLADYRGTVRLKRIAVVDPDEVTEAILGTFGIDKQAYLFFTNLRRQKGVPDYLILFDQFKKEPKPSAPFPSFMYTQILSKEQISNSAVPAVVIDVRSPEEFAASSIPGAENVPVQLPSGVSSTFRWDLSNKSLQDTRFDISRLVPYRDRMIVVVGRSSTDVRPLVALAMLYDAEFVKMGWIYEGMDGSAHKP
jgi:rhodanese-related sulfurtransferase